MKIVSVLKRPQVNLFLFFQLFFSKMSTKPPLEVKPPGGGGGKRPSVSAKGKPRGWKLRRKPAGTKGKPEYDFFPANAVSASCNIS